MFGNRSLPVADAESSGSTASGAAVSSGGHASNTSAGDDSVVHSDEQARTEGGRRGTASVNISSTRRAQLVAEAGTRLVVV